jgi:hypothetical protein
MTPARFRPVIFAVEPPWIRFLEAQFFTQDTPATEGCAT